MARLILDTGVLIEAERGRLDLPDAANPTDDVAIAAVTVAELLTGVERAGTPEVRERRQRFVDMVLETVPVEEYTLDVARAHARLIAHVQTVGEPRGAHDLIIAATAVACSRSVKTTDGRARFDVLPDVHVAD